MYLIQKRNLLIVGLALVFGLSMQSCTDRCKETRRWVYYEPVYTTLDELRTSVNQTTDVRDIVNPGRLYYLNGYMLINQPGEGIHIIDDRDPSNPEYLSFLEVPGNYEIAGKGNYIYMDSYIDLVVMDMSDINNILEVERVTNIFPEYNSYGYYVDPEKGLVTDWEEVETFDTFESDCEGGRYYGDWWYYRGGIALDFAMAEAAAPNVSVAPSSSPGIGGSLAKFTVSSDHLYTIDQSDLSTVNIQTPDQPIILSKVNIGWGIETIFPYEDHLYIGANNGMHIVSIESPQNPFLKSTFSHARACDPVVVQGDYAYVTLRDGTACNNADNQLDVIDISNKSNPVLVSSFALFNPGGLGIDDNTLFICDGAAGMKIFDASNKFAITSNPLAFYPDLIALDVIPFNDILMVIAEDGFYQFDYSDINDIQLLSSIPISYED